MRKITLLGEIFEQCCSTPSEQLNGAEMRQLSYDREIMDVVKTYYQFYWCASCGENWKLEWSEQEHNKKKIRS